MKYLIFLFAFAVMNHAYCFESNEHFVCRKGESLHLDLENNLEIYDGRCIAPISLDLYFFSDGVTVRMGDSTLGFYEDKNIFASSPKSYVSEKYPDIAKLIVEKVSDKLLEVKHYELINEKKEACVGVVKCYKSNS